MTIPINSPWALNPLTDIPCVVPGRGTTLYNNKAAPPLEIQLYGILHNTPFALQEINYQFDMLYQFNEWAKKRQYPQVQTEATTSKTLSAGDLGNYIRFTNAAATTYTINQGLAEVGDTVVLRQGAAGVVTLTPGSGVTFAVPTGKAAKTSGLNTTITMVKISEGVGVETWDLYGDLGV